MPRKALQVLQPSTGNKRVLVGGDGIMRPVKRPIGKKDGKLIVRHNRNDENTVSKEPECKLVSNNENIMKEKDVEAAAVQKSVDDMISSITSAEDSISYWKELAEERRKALVESLQENENLHKLVEELKDENQFLKNQNEALEEIAEEAKQLAELLQDQATETD